MEEKDNVIGYIIEKGLQWLYATREKKLRHRLLIEIFVLSLFVLGATLILYIMESFVLYFYTGNNAAVFTRILSIVVSILFLIILANWGTKQGEYSTVLLSYFHLIMLKRKKEKSKFDKIKGFGVIFVIAFLVLVSCLEMDAISVNLGLNLPETLIVGFVILSMILYIPLTECIIDKVKYYKMKAIVSLVLFVILLYIYILSMLNMSPDDDKSKFEIIIFSISQIAFAESAIGNYKNMVRLEKEQEKKEIEKYLSKVDEAYRKKEEAFQAGISEVQKVMQETIALWKRINWKQRMEIIFALLFLIAFYAILVWVSSKFAMF